MYSRRLRVEQNKDKRSTVLYIFFSIVSLFLLIKFGLPNAVRFIGFLGDLNNASTPTEVDDKTPPPPPYLDNLPKATNQRSFEISGTSEPGVTILYELNGNSQEILANNEGKFIFKLVFQDGENTLSVKAKDKAGNLSVQNTLRKIIYDNIAPKLEISTPKDASHFYGAAKRQLTISGTTEEDAKVQINDRRVIINSDGTFSYVYGLNDGENTLTITSSDEAENKSETVLRVNFTP